MAGHPLSIVTNPFMDGTGATATGWVVISAGTASLVPSMDLVPGNWQRLALVTAGSHVRQTDIPCPADLVGRKVSAAIEVKLDSVTELANLGLQGNQKNASGSVLMSAVGLSGNAGDSGSLDLSVLARA